MALESAPQHRAADAVNGGLSPAIPPMKQLRSQQNHPAVRVSVCPCDFAVFAVKGNHHDRSSKMKRIFIATFSFGLALGLFVLGGKTFSRHNTVRAGRTSAARTSITPSALFQSHGQRHGWLSHDRTVCGGRAVSGQRHLHSLPQWHNGC